MSFEPILNLMDYAAAGSSVSPLEFWYELNGIIVHQEMLDMCNYLLTPSSLLLLSYICIPFIFMTFLCTDQDMEQSCHLGHYIAYVRGNDR